VYFLYGTTIFLGLVPPKTVVTAIRSLQINLLRKCGAHCALVTGGQLLRCCSAAKCHCSARAPYSCLRSRL
jgi:hypothetical protein